MKHCDTCTCDEPRAVAEWDTGDGGVVQYRFINCTPTDFTCQSCGGFWLGTPVVMISGLTYHEGCAP